MEKLTCNEEVEVVKAVITVLMKCVDDNYGRSVNLKEVLCALVRQLLKVGVPQYKELLLMVAKEVGAVTTKTLGVRPDAIIIILGM